MTDLVQQLREWYYALLDKAANRIEQLERENAELRRDRVRLDWLDIHGGERTGLDKTPSGWYALTGLSSYRFNNLREAIDAAMQKEQS